MKRIFALLLTISLLAGFAGCGEKAPETAIEKIQKEGVLNIQAKNVYDETDMTVAGKIAEKLGVEAVYTSGAFELSLAINTEAVSDGMLLSEAYRRERVQIYSAEYSPLAAIKDSYYGVSIENTEFNAGLMDIINAAISECFSNNLIKSLEISEGSLGTPDKSKAYIYDNNPGLTQVNYDSPALLGISEDMGNDYQDKLIIVCDSPNYWIKKFGLLKDGTETTQIWTGPEGTQTFPYYKGYKLLDPYDGSGKVLVELARTYQPEIIIVALGVNGIAKRDEESFSKIYNQMISDLKDACPNTTFVLASIYPVTSTYKNLKLINNELITAGNSWILKTAESYDCHYLDIFSVLVGDDGYAKPELMQGDGLHPNKAGLSLVLDYIRTHACIK